MSVKIREWIDRYLPAEIVGTIFAVLVAWIVFRQTGNHAAGAAAGTIAENIGFYGVISVREFYRHHKKLEGVVSVREYLKVVRNLLVEFGPAELFDSFLVRPASMYTFSRAIDNYGLGVFVGKVVADVGFYGAAIIAYEFRKKYLK